MALALLVIDAALLTTFLRWAYVQHYHIADSLLYLNPRFSAADGSYMEIWGYIKEAIVVALSIGAFLRTSEMFYAAFAVLFSSIFLDDALALHERAGAWLSDPALLGDKASLFAALLVSGLPFAVVLFALIKLPRARRAPALALVGGFCMLAFFAVIVDALHEKLLGGGSGQTIAVLFEDGGELICLTLIIVIWAYFIRPLTRSSRAVTRLSRDGVSKQLPPKGARTPSVSGLEESPARRGEPDWRAPTLSPPPTRALAPTKTSLS
jgi:hypothetical protein